MNPSLCLTDHFDFSFEILEVDLLLVLLGHLLRLGLAVLILRQLREAIFILPQKQKKLK